MLNMCGNKEHIKEMQWYVYTQLDKNEMEELEKG